jgi:citrate lyase beta subunit
MSSVATPAASFGDEFGLTLITDDPVLAGEADAAGVNRIGLDLERLGKAERQAGQSTRLSEHNWDDVATIAHSLLRADLFIRLNPINPDTPNEIEKALRCGARVLMLPFFHTAAEVDTFARLVDQRARIVILLETAPAAVRIREILAVPGVDEVMLGLNDLRLQLGVANIFEVLASPVLDALAGEVRRAGLPLAVGGVARADDSSLPVSPDLVYAQFPRLGATGAWLARSFFRAVPPDWKLGQAIATMRRRLDEWAHASPQALERARNDLADQARRMVVRR